MKLKNAIRKKEPIRRVITESHIFRRINDKPDPREMQILEKAIYHSFKMLTKEASSGTLLYDGKPVAGIGGALDLKELFSKIVHTYSLL